MGVVLLGCASSASEHHVLQDDPAGWNRLPQEADLITSRRMGRCLKESDQVTIPREGEGQQHGPKSWDPEWLLFSTTEFFVAAVANYCSTNHLLVDTGVLGTWSHPTSRRIVLA